MMRTEDRIDMYNTFMALIIAWIIMAVLFVAAYSIKSYAANSGVPNTEIGVNTYNTDYEERISALEKEYDIHPTEDMTIYDRLEALEEAADIH